MSATRLKPKQWLGDVVTLSDGATVSIDPALGHHFKLTGSTGRTLDPSGAGYDRQIIVISWTNSGGGAITHTLATGSSNDFRFPTGVNALSPTAVGGTDYLVAIYNSADSRWDVIGYSGDYVFQNSSAAAGSDVTMTNANTYYDGASISLAAGVWLVTAHISFNRAATTLCQYTARISDGTNHYASSQASHPSQNPHAVSISMSAIITLGSTTTIKIQGASSVATSCVIKAAAANNGAGNNATMINAVKIG